MKRKGKAKKAPELKPPDAVPRDDKGRILPGHTGNPGGVSKEKRAFLERLKDDDSETIYAAGMALIREGNAPMIIRAWEYLLGKPKESVEMKAAVEATVTGKTSLTLEVDPQRLARVAAVLQRAGALTSGESADVGTPDTKEGL